MRWVKRAAVLAVLGSLTVATTADAALLAASPAQAQERIGTVRTTNTGLAMPPGPMSWQTIRSQRIAANVWGNPCAGRVLATWAPFPTEYALPRHTVAMALTDDASYCEVRFNPQMLLTFRLLCTVMVHEYARFAGHTYEDPMNATLAPWTLALATRVGGNWVYDAPGATDARCARRGRAFLSGHVI